MADTEQFTTRKKCVFVKGEHGGMFPEGGGCLLSYTNPTACEQ